MKKPVQYVRKKDSMSLTGSLLLSVVIGAAFAFTGKDHPGKLVFESVKYMRSSFCMYSDGKFYDAHSSGCTEQNFAWGYWENIHDTIVLHYRAQNIFQYDVVRSPDTQSNFQVIRIIDCYDQPVRFQFINHANGYSNLYNTGILKIKKGSPVNYPAPEFGKGNPEIEYISCNADTLTYKWHCNRECLESVNGGYLFIDDNERMEKIVLQQKQVLRLTEL